MPIDVTCSCGKRLRVADEFAGQQGQCPVCGALLAIPATSTILPLAPSLPETAQAVTARVGPSAAVEADTSELPDSSGLPAFPDDYEPSRPWYKLYSPGSIGLVAFLTGPVGAFILLAINFWRLGKNRAARLTILAGVITIVGILYLSFFLPNSGPSMLIGLPLFLMLWIGARTLQGSAYDDHLRQGGASASGWSAAGIGVLGLAAFLVVLFGAEAAFQRSFGPKLDFGGGEEVYYNDGATETDAWALGKFLQRDGFFHGQGPAAVRVSRPGGRLIIEFIVQDWAVNDVGVQNEFRLLGQDAAQQAFGGVPVEVRLCDEFFRVKKKL
ncbi:MAG TPA: hypothetical protein VKE98_08500 [Gemmataceae bacterium]|nr:hypothetical protein [Gemmataceae bacterium]